MPAHFALCFVLFFSQAGAVPPPLAWCCRPFKAQAQPLADQELGSSCETVASSHPHPHPHPHAPLILCIPPRMEPSSRTQEVCSGAACHLCRVPPVPRPPDVTPLPPRRPSRPSVEAPGGPPGPAKAPSPHVVLPGGVPGGSTPTQSGVTASTPPAGAGKQLAVRGCVVVDSRLLRLPIITFHPPTRGPPPPPLTYLLVLRMLLAAIAHARAS